MPNKVLCDDRPQKIIHANFWERRNGAWVIQGVLNEQSLIDKVCALDGESIWVGYTQGGWSWPEDVILEAYLELARLDQKMTYVYIYASASTPDLRYVIVFKTLEKFADSQGDHYAEHPCGGYAVSNQAIEAIYRESTMR